MSRQTLPDTRFWRAYQGRAEGLLNWADIDALWPLLARDPEGWYVYDLETRPPETPLDTEDFMAFLAQAGALVNSRRDRSHSGAVYIDNRATPAFVKIFDPANMGTSCGGDHDMIFPRYILSRIRPDARPAPPPEKTSFLGRLVLKV